MKMSELGEELLHILKKNGWKENRRVAINIWGDFYIKEGYVPPESLRSFLSHWGGIYIPHENYSSSVFGGSDLCLDPLMAPLAYKPDVDEIGRKISKSLFPIGEWGDITIFMTSNDEFFGVYDMENIFFLGENFIEALNQIVFRPQKLIKV